MSTKIDAPAFGAEMYRAASLAAVFLKHVHEGNEAGMQTIIDEVNSSGLLSAFLGATSALAVEFGRHAYGEEELGRALQDCAIRLHRTSCDRPADSP